MTPGRPPAHKPALAFALRRYKTLVDVLALGSTDALYQLARTWNVDSTLPPDALLIALARDVQTKRYWDE